MATPEMVEKSELIALQKSLEDQKVALEKALADVKRFEDEKKEADIVTLMEAKMLEVKKTF